MIKIAVDGSTWIPEQQGGQNNKGTYGVHTVQRKVNWRKIKILWEVSALEDIQVFDTTLGHQKVMEII